MFSGEKINFTETRYFALCFKTKRNLQYFYSSVLHVALRNRSNAPLVVDRKDVGAFNFAMAMTAFVGNGRCKQGARTYEGVFI